MKQLYLLLLGFFVYVGTGLAQTGTEFWFAAPDLQRGHGEAPVFFRITTFEEDVNVTVSLPADPSFAPIQVQIPANTAYNLDMSPYLDQIENRLANTIDQKGILIRSSCHISVYYDIANVFNGDLFALKGDNALGLKFTVPFQMDYQSWYYPDYKKMAIIVSAADNNTITITSPKDLNGIQAGQEIQLTLNAGETYMIQNNSSDPGSGPGGVVVSANKPIAVTIADDSVNLPGNGCADTVGDQLIPDDLAGKQFVLTRGYLYLADAFYVFATKDSTAIYLAGNLVDNINAGEFYSGRLNDQSVYIETSAPVHVLQVSGFGCELGGAIIPALGCTGSESVAVTRATTQDFFINLICAKAYIDNFQIGGDTTFIKAASFQPVPGTDSSWMSARISVPTNVLAARRSVNVTNRAGPFHIGVIHGDRGTTTRFGFFSDFSSTEISITSGIGGACANFQDFCLGSSVEIKADGEGLSNFYWLDENDNRIDGPQLTFDSFAVRDRGFYTIHAFDGGLCGESKKKIYLGGNGIPLDSLTIQMVIRDSCAQDNSFDLFAQTFPHIPKAGYQFSWHIEGQQFNDTSLLNYHFNGPGVYPVQLDITDTTGCLLTTDTILEVLPSPQIELQANYDSFCEGDSTLLRIFSEQTNELHYSWFLNDVLFAQDTISTRTITESGQYLVKATNTVGCEGQTDSLEITFYETFYESTQDTICTGESLQGYTQTGMYQDSSLSSSGCDSITVLNLTVLPQNDTTLQLLFCESSPLFINQQAITASGTYQVNLINQYGCDSLVTVQAEKIESDFLGRDTIICGEGTFAVNSPYEQTLWSDGSIGPSLETGQSQTISALVQGYDQCRVEDAIQVEFTGRVYLPNVFSPNRDGINDCFAAYTNINNFKKFELRIFDRWGTQVFYGQEITDCWDGYSKGIRASAGVYVYLLYYELEGCTPVKKYGDFLLVF